MNYLSSAERQFKMYKGLGEKAMMQVTDDQLFWQPNPEVNSIAIIVQHMRGNMISRWTNFLTEDGEKPWRERDTEFEANIKTREALMQKWEEGWKCLFDALASITNDDLERIIYIRNEGHTVLEAINRQIAHYPYHVGQIVHIGKICAGEAWQSLSIPRNKSRDYNDEKFSHEKERRHFTDDWLNK
ncbi:DUF1572 family protein [Chitinophagaceae bacterium MMS25-I14]